MIECFDHHGMTLVVTIAVLTGSLSACSESQHRSPQPAVALVFGDRDPSADPAQSMRYNTYEINLGGIEQAHPFDIHKYSKIYRQLLEDGIIVSGDVFAPEEISSNQLLLIHTQQYLERLKSPQHVAEYLEASPVALVPPPLLDSGILKPFRHATGGTLLASRLALDHGIAINLGGGYHHAKPDKGEGFCIYADMPIVIRVLQSEKIIRTALVIDLDVHQGNGTIVCLANDETTFTFSMHRADIYPNPKEKGDLDIELEAGTDDQSFLATLDSNLEPLIDKVQPDIVFYQAGCDTLKDDPLASLAMTHQGIVDRDARVIAACVARDIPVVMTLGGGYSQDAWKAQYLSVRNIANQYGLVSKKDLKLQ